LNRRRLEHLEEIRRHAADGDDVGFALMADHGAAAAVERHRLDRRGLAFPVLEVDVRGGAVHRFLRRALRRLPYRQQPIGFGVWQRLQQNAVDHAEDGGGRADTQCQRHDGDERERSLPQQRADGDLNQCRPLS
jgi:hypothetical protein